MTQQLPYHDSTFDRGVSRTYWTYEMARDKKRQLAREAAAATSKRDKKYSRADQGKIASEKWQAVCEAKPASPKEC